MIQWSGYDWSTQERWGQIHTDKNFVWYDDTAVIVDDQGFFHLKTHYNPKYFSDLNVTSNIGVGLISCTSPLKFGTYEIEAKLPEGKNLWPFGCGVLIDCHLKLMFLKLTQIIEGVIFL